MPGVRPTSVSTTGYVDGLGRRVLQFDREAGATVESVQLRPELSVYEHALRVQAAAVAALGDDRFAPVRSIDRDGSRVVVKSELVPGDRLSDIIEARSAGDSGVSGLDAAFGFLLQVLPALSRLHAAGLTHGIVAPGRVILTTSARVILSDTIYGAILPRLNLSRQRLWNELQVAAPPSAGIVRFDAAGDVAQASLCSLMLVLGRAIEGANPIDALPPLLAEAVEIAQIRGGDRLADTVRRYFTTTLPIAGLRTGITAEQAARDARAIATGELGEDACASALAEFLRYDAPAPPVPKPRAARPAPPPPPPPAPLVEEPLRHVETETEPAAIEYEELLAPSHAVEWDAQPEPIREPEPIYTPEPPVFVEPVPVSPLRVEPTIPPPPPPPAPIPPPVIETRPIVAAAPAIEAVRATSPAPEFEPVQIAPPAPVAPIVPPAPEPVHVPEPILAKAPAEPEPLIPRAPIEMGFDPVVFAPPTVVVPPPQAVPPPPPPPMPVFRPQTSAVVTPNPYVFSPGAPTAPAAAPPPPPAPVQAHAPLRLKQDGPVGYAPPRQQMRHEPAMIEPPFMRRHMEETPAGFPKKMAIAAFVIMALAIAGGRYLMTRDRAAAADESKTVAAAKPEPIVHAKAPTPSGSTGTLTIETIPTGAKVLLNGTHAGETPLKLEGLPAGRHTVTLVTDSVTVKRTVRVEAGKTVALDVPVFSGWVAIFAPIVLEVSEGNKGLGSTEQGRILLSPGRHVLTVTNRQYGYSSTHEVEIGAGEETPLNLTPTGRVNLNAVPWAEVWMDGTRIGETPIANLEVPLGTREFVFKHPQHGERRVTTTVTATPAAVSVDFTKPAAPNLH